MFKIFLATLILTAAAFVFALLIDAKYFETVGKRNVDTLEKWRVWSTKFMLLMGAACGISFAGLLVEIVLMILHVRA